MNYQKLIIVGNATSDAQRKTAKKGIMTYIAFSVGVGDAKEHTTFFPVVAFGKYGENIAKHILKGRQVLVEGRVDVTNNGRFNVVANRVLLGIKTGESAKKTK